MTLGRKCVSVVVPILVLGLLLTVPARALDKDDEALKALQSASLTLKKAVELAETATKGTAVAAFTKVRGAKTDVLVYCLADGKCKEVPVNVKKDATAGEAREATAGEEKADYITNATEIAKQLTDSKLTLIKLIETAETSRKGKPISIKPKTIAGKLEFTLRAKVDQKWEFIVVDGKTGKVKGEDKVEKKSTQQQQPAAPGGRGRGAAGGKGAGGKGAGGGRGK